MTDPGVPVESLDVLSVEDIIHQAVALFQLETVFESHGTGRVLSTVLKRKESRKDPIDRSFLTGQSNDAAHVKTSWQSNANSFTFQDHPTSPDLP